MNNITRKTLEKIDEIKPVLRDTEIKEIIERVEKAINLDYQTEQVSHLLDAYSTIEVLLFKACELSEKEAGYIFDKIIKYNYKVNKYKSSLVISYETFEKRNLKREETEDLLKRYYSENITQDEQNILEEIFLEEEKKMAFVKNSYEIVENFSKKRTHSKKEYEELTNALKALKVPDRLIESYIKFYEGKEKVETKEEIKPQKKKKQVEDIPTRKELKSKLKSLYHEGILDEYFDMKDIVEVLKVVKLLSLTDERIRLILNDLYRSSIKNENYYNFLINKVAYLNKYKEKLQEIEEIKEMLEIDDMKNEATTWLEEIYESMKHIMTDSFEYEENIYQKIKLP